MFRSTSYPNHKLTNSSVDRNSLLIIVGKKKKTTNPLNLSIPYSKPPKSHHTFSRKAGSHFKALLAVPPIYASIPHPHPCHTKAHLLYSKEFESSRLFSSPFSPLGHMDV